MKERHEQSHPTGLGKTQPATDLMPALTLLAFSQGGDAGDAGR